MKVSKLKEYLSAYSDDEELMIVWNDKSNFEFIYDKELPNDIWQEAVKVFDLADLQYFTEDCHSFVIEAKDKLEGNK